MTDPTVDIAALLRTLTEQQTALLSAHAESARMQRVLVEQLLGSQVGPAVAAEAAPTVVTASPPTESPPVVAPAPLAEAPAPAGVLSDVDKPAEIVARVTESPAPVEPLSTSPPGERPALRVVGGTALRSERYYQSKPTTEPMPARPICAEALDVLRRIQDAGEVAHLILMFGPHAGETLGQVARSDPEYLRHLAMTAQRSDVRAAAGRLVSALPSSPPVHGRRTPQRSRRGTWRGAG